jgi:deoxyribonuclease (pyrimidine dimer)
MTRINVVPVSELTDNFLLAEYFELPRLFPLIEKHVHKVEVLDKPGGRIPEHYVLGEGHMRFFYDKLFYLYDRHNKLYEEGIKRGLDLKVDPRVPDKYLEGPMLQVSSFWYKNYVPTFEAQQLNWNRLQYRRRYDGGTYTIP